MTSLRRILWLIVACLAVASAYIAWQRRRSEDALAGEPEWPPFDVPPERVVAATTSEAVPPDSGPAATPAAGAPAAAAPAAPAAAWVPAVDGACPDGYPVKAKQSSRIYHVPGGRFYERTVPDRCYTDPDSAEIDGYRASKS
jgi:hypothetical protein